MGLSPPTVRPMTSRRAGRRGFPLALGLQESWEQGQFTLPTEGLEGDNAPMATPPPSPARPDWIRVRTRPDAGLDGLRARLSALGLNTVCEAAACPNLGHCWSRGHATVMILGDRCTRGCRFCNVDRRPVLPPAPDEPERVAKAVLDAGTLEEIVITSVTRDDLPDGGAAIWAKTVRAVRAAAPSVRIEVLVPDFKGRPEDIATVADTRPEVFGHNLEMPGRLYPAFRPEADFDRSLAVLRQAAKAGLLAKTSLMLGLGETREELLETFRRARDAGARILFLGQYLQPSKRHCPVVRYLPPGEFDELRHAAMDIGFDVVASAPLVRSSYHDDAQTDFVRAFYAGSNPQAEATRKRG
jgi:lipoic acid synthetase